MGRLAIVIFALLMAAHYGYDVTWMLATAMVLFIGWLAVVAGGGFVNKSNSGELK